MSIYILNPKTGIVNIPADAAKIHMSFRPSALDILDVLDQCPVLEILDLPHSHKGAKLRLVERILHRAGVKLTFGLYETRSWRTDLHGNEAEVVGSEVA